MNSPDNMTLQATVEGDGAKKASPIDESTWSEGFAWIARVLILLAVVAAPWMIGSVQFWSQFWISTAVLVAMAFWWFETALNKRNVQVLPYIAAFLLLGIGIGLFQLMPISGWIGDIFLGRQAELYQRFAEPAAGAAEQLTSSPSQRISLNTNGTWHQIRLLVIALSALLLSCRYFRTPRDLTIFLATLTINGVALSIFGLIQKLTSEGDKLFWTIELQAGGSPFGPYVNRNNAGGYLLICLACSVGLMYFLMSNRKNRGPLPIISKEIPVWRQFSQHFLYFISELTAIKMASLIAIVFIAAGIMATVSRGAILALLFATMLTVFSYGVAKRPKNMSVILIPLTVAIALLTVWLGFSDKIVGRFEQLDTTQDISEWNARVETWKDTWPSVAEMGKLGSGLGTYENVSRLYRTGKETKVFRHAENQYFQTLIEAGWPGLIIYLLAWLLAFYYAYFLLKIGQSPATVSVGLAGVFLLWAQAVASFLDFGFYIPANTLGMASVMGVISYSAHSMAYRLKQSSWLRLHFPNSFVQAILVVVFAACTLVSLDLNRKSRIESIRGPKILTFENLDHKQASSKIKSLSTLAVNSRSVAAANELGRLWVHCARLEMFDRYRKELNLDVTDREQNQRLWDEVSLIRIHDRSESFRKLSSLSQNQFRNHDSLQVNLPLARTWFDASLKLSPLQPEVQVMLGQIQCILDDIDSAEDYLERGIELAPTNVSLLRHVAVLYLQANEFEKAAPHLKQLLSVDSVQFKTMLELVLLHMSSNEQQPDYELILQSMLPDDPSLLYQFSQDYALPQSVTQKAALERAEELLADVSQSELYVKVLLGRIKIAMGDISTGVDHLNSALNSNPNNQKVRSYLVEILVAEERYEEALEHAGELIRSNDKNRRYRQVFDSIKSKIDEQKKFEQ